MGSTSITLQNFDATELAKAISIYLMNKEIPSTVVTYSSNGERVNANISLVVPHQLSLFLEKSIEDQEMHFLLKIPEIKTTFEKFVYGIEANSNENDFLSTFRKFV